MPDIVGRLRTPRLAAAPSSPVVGEVYYDTALNTLYWWNGTVWVASGTATPYSPPTVVTSLPGSPTNGQEVYYVADATARILWHLRYNAGSASAYKWEFVGGPPIYAQTDADEGSSGGDNNHTSPILTIPLAGDYYLGFNNSVQGQPTTANLQVRWANQININGVNIGEPYYDSFWYVAAASVIYRQTLNLIPTARGGVTVGSVIKLYHLVTNWDYTSLARTITALPIRVG